MGLLLFIYALQLIDRLLYRSQVIVHNYWQINEHFYIFLLIQIMINLLNFDISPFHLKPLLRKIKLHLKYINCYNNSKKNIGDIYIKYIYYLSMEVVYFD